MLKACSVCGGIHEWGMCPIKVERNTNKKNTTSNLFRNTAQWQRKRKEILKRDKYICRVCWDNLILTRSRLEVHHIIPIKADESLKLVDDNLITVCRECHELIENDRNKIGYLQRLAKVSPHTKD